MTADVMAERGRLDIGRVISETLQVLRRNIVTFSILGLLLAGLPMGIITFIQARTMGGLATGKFSFSSGYFGAIGIGGLTAMITNAILQGALIYATVQDLNGRKASVGDSLATGLRNFLPLLGVTILFAVAFVLSSLLLIFPAIMLACAWCVVAPSVVADRTGVFGAFGRSAELTRGSRWPIFGLFVLLAVFFIVLGTVFNVLSGVSMMAANPAAIVAQMTSPLFVIMGVIRQTIGAMIGSTLVAVLYVELRRAREGAGPQWLADIFS
ncbi:MAG: hypothetical protein JF588_01490 [Caulobacterales bacterium]|nr:hypothetical protein [Caulobacterales bacterium]